ncbi:hypothetical protein M3Y97_01027500 [Aphelenchoides bicaudatus]|nr:hypothetical protein M3Y97_01027500 [Aphelenchoides bicaudatus]
MPYGVKQRPDFSFFEFMQLHVILGKADSTPALVSSGVFVLEKVEAAELDPSITILPPGGLTYIPSGGGMNVADMLNKLHNEFLMLDERSRAALSCMPHEKSLCENAELCVRPTNSSFFKCVCREGYAGQYCQFSLFPPTCTEALSADPKRKPGIYQLDVDGSGPLRATHAECLRDGRTVITHNAPNRTQIRQPNDTSHAYYPITYRHYFNFVNEMTLKFKALFKPST